jgi:hypothetical protein
MKVPPASDSETAPPADTDDYVKNALGIIGELVGR